MQPLYHLTGIEYDKQSLLEEANKFIDIAPPYYDPRYDEYIDGWKIIKGNEYSLPLAEKVSRQFLLEGIKPRYYIQEKNVVVPVHTDNNTQCSINIILSDNYSPVTINGIDYTYKQCILNTTLPHGVYNGNEDRYLLKFTIMNNTFNDCVKHLKRLGFINDKL
jgi:hypothetical protein